MVRGHSLTRVNFSTDVATTFRHAARIDTLAIGRDLLTGPFRRRQIREKCRLKIDGRQRSDRLHALFDIIGIVALASARDDPDIRRGSDFELARRN